MTVFTYRNSRPSSWVSPRPHQDALQRLHTYGPIQPMDKPGLLERLLKRRRH